MKSGLRLRHVDAGCLRLQIESNNAGLEAGQLALREFLEAAGSSDRAVYLTELAFDELAGNVIKYADGYRDTPSSLIDISARVPGEEIVLTVEDDGPPFNPLEMPYPAAPARLEDARVGGLGLVLVRMAAMRMEYERVAGRNRVSLRIQRR